MSFVTLTIDGVTVRARAGESVVEAAKRVNIHIPTLCYLKDLEVVSACRMCLVRIEGVGKLMTGCSTPVVEGMVVVTEDEQIAQHRRTLLRLYLDNHPNDCLTCQKAGECELQNLSYRYDVKFRDHEGARRGKPTAEFSDTTSPYILRDESKCILCGRCVRTCAKVETRNVLTFANRGFVTKISADADQTLEESTCVSCNRCVVACPVGALVDRRVYGKIRPWQSKTKGVKCKACDYGCNMEILVDKGTPVAVRAKAPQGEDRPLCLKGRLMTEFEYVYGPEAPFKKIDQDDKRVFVETDWADALELSGIFEKLQSLREEE
ncbi:MAG: 2Fe-2S iron-sulfur cluster-binding protein [Tissierellia bacterium]|nr:2Fe-2S iron-sulfur cluster-binding protein [Tissierellia bacterium]